MVEFTQGIFTAAKNVYKSNRGSILRTIVYTIGHFKNTIAIIPRFKKFNVNRRCFI